MSQNVTGILYVTNVELWQSQPDETLLTADTPPPHLESQQIQEDDEENQSDKESDDENSDSSSAMDEASDNEGSVQTVMGNETISFIQSGIDNPCPSQEIRDHISEWFHKMLEIPDNQRSFSETNEGLLYIRRIKGDEVGDQWDPVGKPQNPWENPEAARHPICGQTLYLHTQWLDHARTLAG